MKRTIRILSLILIVCLMHGCLSIQAWALPVYSAAENDSQIVTAILLLEGDAAAETEPAVRALQVRKLAAQHKRVGAALSETAPSWEPLYDYSTLLNGLAVRIRRAELARVASIPGVKSVHIANTYAPPETVQTEYANQMISADWFQKAGYSGSGTVIAVLDTGITARHEVFQVYPGTLSAAAVKEAGAKAVIQDLGYGAWVSQKIPFAYDYADRDNDAEDDRSGHGTHVAAIAAGYASQEDGAVSFSGTAPDAQILAMKIFSSQGSVSTDSSIYFKAMEDAYLLGADVINMSLGSQNGFTYDPELDGAFGNIYQTLRKNGVICVVAAGNEGSMAQNALTHAGPGCVSSDYMDYGVVGSPSTYLANLSVASAENTSYPGALIEAGGRKIALYESENGFFFSAFSGSAENRLVVVPGYGAPEDYSGLDVSGRFALIRRGELSFQEKIENAAHAGAKGALIYNNTDGIFHMSVDTFAIPAAAISCQDGEALIELCRNNAGVFSVPERYAPVSSEQAWCVSDFSSWGVAPDLTPKPALTGVGGNVYAAQAGSTDGYVLMSDTSMATPNVSGALADLIGYLRKTHPELDKKAVGPAAEAMLQSTARILTATQATDDSAQDARWFSPRQQGAGLVDLKAASEARAYLVQPLIQAGDNADGVFELSFAIKNLTKTPLAFVPEPTVLTDDITSVSSEDGGSARAYNTLTSVRIEDDCDLTGPGTIRVPAGGTAKVRMRLRLNDAIRTLLDQKAPNGAFAEGFVTLKQVPFTDPSDEEACDGIANCPGAVFTDMPAPANWAHDGIDYAVMHGLFAGTSETTFSPEQPMTRAMLVTVLYRLAGSPAVTQENPFADVPRTHYYYDPVRWAAAEGIVNGTSQTAFSPNDNITRQQMAAILYRYAAKIGCDMSKTLPLDGFPDHEIVSAYAVQPLGWAVANGIISGDKTETQILISPTGNATRAQVATILTRFMRGFARPSVQFEPGSDLHATFVGFYGDWAKAPILEPHDWREIVDLNNRLREPYPDDPDYTYADYGYTALDLADFDVTAGVNMVYACNRRDTLEEGLSPFQLAGDNLYTAQPFRAQHIAISHNSYYDMLYASPILLRNARHLIMVASDAVHGEVYTVDDTEYLPKAVYDGEEEAWKATGIFLFDGTDLSGEPLLNGTKVRLDFYANLDYGPDRLGELAYDELCTAGSDYLVWSFQVTIDDIPPSFENRQYDAASRTLTVTVFDDRYLSHLMLGDQHSGDQIGVFGFSDESPGQTHTVVFRDVDPGDYVLSLYDYAGNTDEMVLTLP